MVVFPMPRWPEKNVAVRDAVLRQRIQKGARDVILARHIGKALWAVFPGQNLISHVSFRSLGRCGLQTAQGDCIVPGWGSAGAEIDADSGRLFRCGVLFGLQLMTW